MYERDLPYLSETALSKVYLVLKNYVILPKFFKDLLWSSWLDQTMQRIQFCADGKDTMQKYVGCFRALMRPLMNCSYILISTAASTLQIISSIYITDFIQESQPGKYTSNTGQHIIGYVKCIFRVANASKWEQSAIRLRPCAIAFCGSQTWL